MGNAGTPSRCYAQAAQPIHSTAVVCIGALIEVHVGPGLVRLRLVPVLLLGLLGGILDMLFEHLGRTNPCIGKNTMRIDGIGVIVLDDELLAAPEVPASCNALGDHHGAGSGSTCNPMRREERSPWRAMRSMPFTSNSCA